MGGPHRRHQSDVPSACTIPGRPTDASFSLAKHTDQQRARSLSFFALCLAAATARSAPNLLGRSTQKSTKILTLW